MGGVVVGAGEGFVTGLPVEATDALVMDTVFLVMSCMVAGKAEWFFGCGIAEGEMVEFLEERESIKAMEGVYKVSFLFIYDRVGGSDIFEMVMSLLIRYTHIPFYFRFSFTFPTRRSSDLETDLVNTFHHLDGFSFLEELYHLPLHYAASKEPFCLSCYHTGH